MFVQLCIRRDWIVKYTRDIVRLEFNLIHFFYFKFSIEVIEKRFTHVIAMLWQQDQCRIIQVESTVLGTY